MADKYKDVFVAGPGQQYNPEQPDQRIEVPPQRGSVLTRAPQGSVAERILQGILQRRAAQSQAAGTPTAPTQPVITPDRSQSFAPLEPSTPISEPKFEKALANTLGYEGPGIDRNEVGDSGISQLGVTQKAWDAYSDKLKLPRKHVTKLTPQERKSFYKDEYAKPLNLENLPDDVAMVAFDYGVNAGPGRAARDLQTVLGVKADGAIGPKTLAAIKNQNPKALAEKLLAMQEHHYVSLVKQNPAKYGKFAKGWQNRVDAQRKKLGVGNYAQKLQQALQIEKQHPDIPFPEDPDMKIHFNPWVSQTLTALNHIAAQIARVPAYVYSGATLNWNIIHDLTGLGHEAITPDWLVNNPIAKYFDRAAELHDMSDERFGYVTEADENGITSTRPSNLIDKIQAGDKSEIAAYIGWSVLENLPQAVIQLGAMVSGVGEAALITMAVTSAAGKTGDNSKAKNVSQAMKTIDAGITGSLEYVTEHMGTFSVFKEAEKQITKAMGKATAKEIIFEGVKIVLNGSVTEAQEEAVNSLAGDITDWITGINPKALKGALGRAFEAAVTASFSSATTTIPAAGISAAAKNMEQATIDQQVRIDAMRQDGERYKAGQLDDGSISSESRYKVSPLGFYSSAFQAIQDKLPSSATPDQVRGILKNTPGVKQEEQRRNKEGLAFIQKYLPELVGAVVQPSSLTTNSGMRILGDYLAGRIRVKSGQPLPIYKHEGFHAFFDLFISPKDKIRLLDAIQREYPDRVKAYADKYGVSQDRAAEEVMAEIMETIDNKRFVYDGKSIPEQIVTFLQHVIEKMKVFFGIDKAIIQYMADAFYEMRRDFNKRVDNRRGFLRVGSNQQDSSNSKNKIDERDSDILKDIDQKINYGGYTEAQIIKEYAERGIEIEFKDNAVRIGGSKVAEPLTRIEDEALIQILTEAVRDAKDVRKEQHKLYSKARSQKIAKAMAVAGKTTGERGFYSELGALRGELPKAQFEAIREAFSQENIDRLFNMIKDHAGLTPFEKINARSALAKMFGEFGGTVPTRSEVGLLDKVFGTEFTKALLGKRTLMERIRDEFMGTLNIPRSLMASFDLSAPFRQGLFFIGRGKQFWPAFGRMFKYFGSEKAFNALQDSITSDPLYALADESGLAMTQLGALIEQREEAFMSTVAEKIPGIGRIVRSSGRAYVGFLNKLRFDVFKDLYTKAKKAGFDPDEDRDLTVAIAKFINNATGRGDLGSFERAAVVLNGVFFSPRLMASRINMLNPVYYAKQPPFVRKEMLMSLLSFVSIGMTILGLAILGGADGEDDPRNADFGKIKIGNTRFDIWGGFQQYIKLVAQLISGKIISSTTGKEIVLGEGYKPITRLAVIARFLSSKEAPVASFIQGWLEGVNGVGDKFDPKSEFAARFVPMTFQSLYDIAKEDPTLLPAGALGAFGVGVQTYSDKKKGGLKLLQPSGSSSGSKLKLLQ